MTDVFLGFIALGVVVMATIQVAIVVAAWRAASKAGEVAQRLEEEIKPVLANLRSMSADVARTSALVATQVERLDQLTTTVARRVDETTTALQESILRPVKDTLAFLQGLKGVVSALGGARAARRAHGADAAARPQSAAPSEQPTAHDEPELFV